jgi:hypothetical protein
VLRGYEMCMEGAGHKLLMNISHKNPNGEVRKCFGNPSIGLKYKSIDSRKDFCPF